MFKSIKHTNIISYCIKKCKAMSKHHFIIIFILFLTIFSHSLVANAVHMHGSGFVNVPLPTAEIVEAIDPMVGRDFGRIIGGRIENREGTRYVIYDLEVIYKLTASNVALTYFYTYTYREIGHHKWQLIEVNHFDMDFARRVRRIELDTFWTHASGTPFLNPAGVTVALKKINTDGSIGAPIMDFRQTGLRVLEYTRPIVQRTGCNREYFEYWSMQQPRSPQTPPPTPAPPTPTPPSQPTQPSQPTRPTTPQQPSQPSTPAPTQPVTPVHPEQPVILHPDQIFLAKFVTELDAEQLGIVAEVTSNFEDINDINIRLLSKDGLDNFTIYALRSTGRRTRELNNHTRTGILGIFGSEVPPLDSNIISFTYDEQDIEENGFVFILAVNEEGEFFSHRIDIREITRQVIEQRLELVNAAVQEPRGRNVIVNVLHAIRNAASNLGRTISNWFR